MHDTAKPKPWLKTFRRKFPLNKCLKATLFHLKDLPNHSPDPSINFDSALIKNKAHDPLAIFIIQRKLPQYHKWNLQCYPYVIIKQSPRTKWWELEMKTVRRREKIPSCIRRLGTLGHKWNHSLGMRLDFNLSAFATTELS